jgi:hypothetical protein
MQIDVCLKANARGGTAANVGGYQILVTCR